MPSEIDLLGQYQLPCEKNNRQPLMQWNLVTSLTNDIAREAEIAGIKPHDLIFIGGIAIYLHALRNIGSKTATRWRGTHDIDLLVMDKGGSGKILTALRGSGKYKYVKSTVSHFTGKKTWEFQFRPKGYLEEEKNRLDLDVYGLEGQTNSIVFNKRTIKPYPHDFIAEPVRLTSISSGLNRHSVAIPSPLDCLIMKLDVACIDGKLREKDKSDILTLLTISEREGKPATECFRGALFHIYGDRETNLVLTELKDLLSLASKCQRQSGSEMGIFTPSFDYLQSCLEAIKQMKRGC